MSEQDFNQKEHRDFYQSFREDVSDWVKNKGLTGKMADYLLLGPDLFHLLVKLSLDSDVLAKNKAKLAGSIAYFLTPIDVLPEALLGPIGYLDDIGLAAYVLREIMDDVPRQKLLDYWAGDKPLFSFTEDVLELVDRKIGQGAWKKILSYLPS